MIPVAEQERDAKIKDAFARLIRARQAFNDACGYEDEQTALEELGAAYRAKREAEAIRLPKVNLKKHVERQNYNNAQRINWSE